MARITSVFLCIVLLLAVGTMATALPKISKVEIAPSNLVAGDMLRMAVTVDDPEGVVKALTFVLRELPGMQENLPQLKPGVWGFEFKMTEEFLPAVYHLDLIPRDAEGYRLKLAPGSQTTAVFTIGKPQLTATKPAPPFQPDLPAVRMTTVDGKPIIVRNPYRGYANWYKGVLHCHTTNSDGRTPPDVLVGKYLADGCSWLQIADHDVVTKTDRSPEGKQIVRIFGHERGTLDGDVVCINYDGSSITLTAQETINAVVAKGGMALLAHPESPVGYELAELDALQGMAMIEVAGRTDVARPWDYLLGTGKVVWGVASDDFHGGPDDSVCAGFVVVNAPVCTPQEILENLRGGNFYASQGPALRVEVKNGTLRASSDDEGSFMFRGPFGIRLLTLRAIDRRSATCELKPDDRYVRVEFTRSADGKRAWSQPIFVSPAK